MGDSFEMTGAYSFKDQSNSDTRQSQRSMTRISVMGMIGLVLSVFTLGVAVGITYITLQNHQELSTSISEIKTQLQHLVQEGSASAQRAIGNIPVLPTNEPTPQPPKTTDITHINQEGYNREDEGIVTQIQQLMQNFTLETEKQLLKMESIVRTMAPTAPSRQDTVSGVTSIPAPDNATTIIDVLQNISSKIKLYHSDDFQRAEREFLQNLNTSLNEAESQNQKALTEKVETVLDTRLANVGQIINGSLAFIQQLVKEGVTAVTNASIRNNESHYQVMEGISALQDQIRDSFSSFSLLHGAVADRLKESEYALSAIENNTVGAINLVQAAIDTIQGRTSSIMTILGHSFTEMKLVFNGSFGRLNDLVNMENKNQETAATTAFKEIQTLLNQKYAMFVGNMSRLVDEVISGKEDTNEALFTITQTLINQSDLDSLSLDLRTFSTAEYRNLKLSIEREFESLNTSLEHYSYQFTNLTESNLQETTSLITTQFQQIDIKKQVEHIIAELSSLECNMSRQDTVPDIHSNVVNEIQNTLAQLRVDTRNISQSLTFEDEKTEQRVRLQDMMSSLYHKFQNANVLLYTKNLSLVEATTSGDNRELSILEKGNYRINNMRIIVSGNSIKIQGRIEVYARNQWGTVCDDNFDNTDATVACRSLGFQSGQAQGSAAFGPGVGSIWLDDLNCSGNENNLLACSNGGLGTHNCGHNEDAGITCS